MERRIMVEDKQTGMTLSVPEDRLDKMKAGRKPEDWTPAMKGAYRELVSKIMRSKQK